MQEIGQYIKSLRKYNNLFLRELASSLLIDKAILSKIERGERRATREQVIAISDFFQIKNDKLKVLWLSDRIMHELKEDKDLTDQVLKVVKIRIKHTEN